MEQDEDGDATIVHRLLHPNAPFPFNLPKPIPKSPYIVHKRIYPKFPLFCAFIIFTIFSVVAFLYLLRLDIFSSYHENNLTGFRNDCIGNCTIPNVIRNNDDEYSIPIKNLTLHRTVNHQISKYQYEVWNFYYGNVTSDDFCLSKTADLALECFKLSFPNNQSGTLYYLSDYSPFINNTFSRNSLVLIDNDIYRFKFVSPLYNEHIGFISDLSTGLTAILIAFVLIIVIILFSCFCLKGKDLDTELINQNSEIVKNFNGRVVLQPLLYKYKHSYEPEERALFIKKNGTVVRNEKYGQKERLLIASLLCRGEQILSYELLSSNFALNLSHGQLKPILTLIVTCFVISGIDMGVFFFGLLILGITSLFPIMLWLSILTCLALTLNIFTPSEAHYILTSRQFIVIESGLQTDIYRIKLRRISDISTRSVLWKGNEMERYRHELIVTLGDDTNMYNRGVLAVHVTDPHYYVRSVIDMTLNELSDNDHEY